MNPDHENLCSSPEWAAHLRAQILPVVTAGVSLGKDMLEIGPGPGAATAWLHERVAHLTVLEADEAAATRLAARYPDSNVTVDIGDATQMPYGDESFDSVGSFTMLHHVPTAAAQYQILAEALRVLRPGGLLAGSTAWPATACTTSTVTTATTRQSRQRCWYGSASSASRRSRSRSAMG